MNPHDRRVQLEVRNAAMREQVNSLLAGLNRQSAALQKAQVQAAEVTGRATSADGLVTVTVNAVGIVTDVQLAPSAFDRSTPDKLACSVVTVTQQAANAAQRQVEDALAPARGELPDLPDVVSGAPSLKDLLPAMSSANRRSQQSPEDDDEDFSTRSVLRRGDR